MTIYLVRHGPAEERGGPGPDAERALTRPGKSKTKKAMKGFVRLGARPDLVLSSPLVRAWETAEILAAALGRVGSSAGRPRVEEDLAPGGDALALLHRLEAGPDAVALVGHEPDLSRLGALLAGGVFELKKAGAARIDGAPSPGGGRLVWLATPLLLRRLAR